MNKVISVFFAGLIIMGSTFAFAEDVYVTKNGKRYHKADCLLIKDKGAKPISMEESEKKSMKPCRRCYPAPAVAAAPDMAALDNQTVTK